MLYNDGSGHKMFNEHGAELLDDHVGRGVITKADANHEPYWTNPTNIAGAVSLFYDAMITGAVEI